MITRTVGRLALIASLCLIAVAAVPVRAAATFTDPQGRFSFTVPDGYASQPDLIKPPIVAAFAATNPAGVSFTAQVREATGTLDAAVTALQQEYVTGAGGTLGPDGPRALTLGGQPAQRYDFFTTDGGVRSHIAQAATIKGGALFILTFAAPEAQYDTLIGQTAGVLSSFSFSATPNQAAATPAAAAPVSPGSGINSNTYTDPKGRYAFTIPRLFSLASLPDGSQFDVEFEAGGNGGLRALFAVEAFTVSATPSLDQLAAALRDGTPSGTYKFISDSPTTMGGIAARQLEWTRDISNGNTLRFIDVATVRSQVVYRIEFVTPDSLANQYSSTLDDLRTSFRILGGSSQPAQPSQPTPTAAPTTTVPPTPTPPASAPPPSNPPPTPASDPKGNTRD